MNQCSDLPFQWKVQNQSDYATCVIERFTIFPREYFGDSAADGASVLFKVECGVNACIQDVWICIVAVCAFWEIYS